MTSSTKSLLSFLNRTSRPNDVFTVEDFTDEHLMLRQTVRKFVERDAFPVLRLIEQKQFEETKKLMLKAGELGLIAADISEEDGGLGLGKVSAAIIAEEMAKSRSFNITFSGQTGIGALPIALFGTKEQKARYLPKLLTGEQIAAYALTEPSAGTDALGIKTSAVLSPCGKYYILNGEKQWITNSGFADIFIVYAKVDRKHFTAFIVEADREGLSTGPEENKMGLDGSSTRSLILDQVHVPAENVIGEIGRGHIIAFNVLNFGRHKIALSSLGTAKRAMELAIDYGKTRQQFNKPLTSFNLIREKIADMAVQTLAVESVVYRTAGELEEAFSEPYDSIAKLVARFAVHCSINKVLATEAVWKIVDEALQIHGGYGYMREYEIEQLYRDVRINRIFEGTNEINRILIAGHIVKEYEPAIEEENNLNGPFGEEMQKITMARNIFKELIESARSNKSDMNEEQELAAAIADMVIGLYAMDSLLVRAQKAEADQRIKIAAKIYVHETLQHFIRLSLYLKNYIGIGQQTIQKAQQVVANSHDNYVGLKRQLAEIVIP